MLSQFIFIAVLVLLLHWPYRWHRTWDFLGRESGELRAVMFTYSYGPSQDALDYHGLRRLLDWLLLSIGQVINQIQPDLIAWFVEIIRQLLGL